MKLRVSESHFDDKAAPHRRPVVSILFLFSSVMVTKHVCFLSFVLFYPMCCLENKMKRKIRKKKLFSSPLHADIYRTVTPSDLWLTSAVSLLFWALAPSVMEASGVKQKLKECMFFLKYMTIGNNQAKYGLNLSCRCSENGSWQDLNTQFRPQSIKAGIF